MQYLHPSVEAKIVDNSHVYQTADGTTALFQVLRAAKGPDNKLTPITTEEEYIFTFGKPNITKYGQGGYNVIEWVKAGGIAYVIRVLPEDASYSTLFLTATINTDLSSGSATKKIQFKRVDKKYATHNSIRSDISTMSVTPADKTQTAVVPIGAILPKGRGDGYSYGVRFILKSDLDPTFNFRTYDAIITTKDSLGNDADLEGPFIVSFDPEAMSKSNESMYWASVINKYSNYVEVIDNRKAFSDITKYLLTKDNVDPTGIDFMFLQPRVGKNEEAIYTPISIDKVTAITSPDEKEADLTKILQLTKGTEGTWEGGNSVDSLYINAYNGVTDPSVLDASSLDLDVLLDANYSDKVKTAMADFSSKQRDDTLAILDLNFQANEQQTLTHRNEKVNQAHRNVAVFAHDMYVYDKHNGEDIKVTTPYLLASKIPNIDKEFGIQYPFVGPRRGVISGFTNLNFYPNPFWREKFYKARVNYIERDPRRINLATQSTSQAETSALSNINNMRVLMKIKREVSRMMSDFRFEYNDEATYQSANYSLNGYLQQWVANRACTSISGTMYASEYDKLQKIARVDIQLTFNGVIERIAIQIVVNR